VSFLERQLDDPRRFARIKRLFYAGLALVALAEIVLSKIIGKLWLMRREDYYDS